MEHLVAWLTLKNISGIGNLLFYRLVKHFGSPEKVLNASVASLKSVKGISTLMANAISNHHSPNRALREIECCNTKGFRIITQQDSSYPALLRHIPDPPPILYCYGDLTGDACHIAVVGSRKATPYGKRCGRRLSRDLSSRGLSIVSGMAHGIDTAAHIGALSAGGHTIAVLGSGLDRIYPAENRKLFHQIAENGAVLSEFSLKTGPKPHHFPQRNRIISGMALGTVVVEAASRSGALITARLAAEQGREVFAVPGNIHSETTRGTHDLIKQGAKLVENSEDIIEEVAPHIAPNDLSTQTVNQSQPQTGTVPDLSEPEKQLLNIIGPYPVHIDELVRQSNLSVGALTATLSQLEIKGTIHQEPGKFYVRDHVRMKNN